MEGVLDGALGALGDEHLGGGDGVLLSSFVKSMKSCFGGMTTSFCFLEVLECEVLGGVMMIKMMNDEMKNGDYGGNL